MKTFLVFKVLFVKFRIFYAKRVNLPVNGENSKICRRFAPFPPKGGV